jgi:hypothetical protein
LQSSSPDHASFRFTHYSEFVQSVVFFFLLVAVVSQFAPSVTKFLVRWLLFPTLSLSLTPLLLVKSIGEAPVSPRGFGAVVVKDPSPAASAGGFRDAAHYSTDYGRRQYGQGSEVVRYESFDASVGVEREALATWIRLLSPVVVVALWAFMHRRCLAAVLLSVFQGRSERYVRLVLIHLFTSHGLLIFLWFALLRPGDVYLSDLAQFPGHSLLGAGLLALSVLPGYFLWWLWVEDAIQIFVTPILWIPMPGQLLGFGLVAEWGTDKDMMFCTLV